MLITEYVSVAPEQGYKLPVIGEGCEGAAFCTVTARDCEGPVPQGFEGTTVIFPEIFPTVARIELVPWPEVIVHPDGTVQV